MKAKTIILLLSISIIYLAACDRSSERRKIRLSDKYVDRANKQLTTTIHLEPNEQRSIAVMFFENLTGDNNLAWLQKGLTEMFIRTLSQSRSLSVLSSDRLFEILDHLGHAENIPNEIDMDMAAVVAKEANVKAVVTGNIMKSGDSLQINVKIHEPVQGMIVKEQSIEGPGLEKIFAMVDQLTQDIKQDLQLTLEKDEQDIGIAELCTPSLDAWKHYTSGVEWANKLLVANAIPEFEKAIELDSCFIGAYLELIEAFLTQHDFNQAFSLFKKMKKFREYATAQEQYQMDIFDAMIKDDLRTMLETYQKWLKEYPNDNDALYKVASFYFSTQNYHKAIPYYEKVLSRDPTYKLAINQMGYSYAYIGEFEKALSLIDHYLQMAPDEPNPYDSKGEIYSYFGEFDKAEKAFKRALKTNEDFIQSWYHLANIELDQGNFPNALQHFETFTAKNKSDSEHLKSFFFTGITLWRLGEKEQAIASLKKALPGFNSKHNILTLIHELYCETGQREKAEQFLIQAYDDLKKSLNKRNPASPTLNDMILLSITHNIKEQETHKIIKQEIAENDNTYLTLPLKFLMTVFFAKTKNYKDIDSLWVNFSNKEKILIFKELNNLSFSNACSYYSCINQAYYQSPAEGIHYYRDLIEKSKIQDSKFSEMLFRLFKTDLYYHIGNMDSVKKELTIIGSPQESDWMVIGPFDNTNGFHKKFKPENEFRLDKEYNGVRWKHHEDDFHDGFINLRQSITQSNWSVAYGTINIQTPNERKVQIRIGTNEAFKLWLNNEEIWKFNTQRNAVLDNDIINVTLKQGQNIILIKVCNRIGNWGFYFRVTDEQGDGLKDIQFIPMDQNV